MTSYQNYKGKIPQWNKKRKYTPAVKKPYYAKAKWQGFTRQFTSALEKKSLDTYISGNFDATGEVLPGGGTSTGINLIPQGATAVTRVGNRCTITNISVRGWVSSGTVEGGTYRMLLVLDTQANGAYPAWNDVIANTGATETTEFNNLDNSRRFRILKDWYGWIGPLGITTNFDSNTRGYGNKNYIIKYNKKCSIPLEFNGATGAIAELRSNNICFMGCSNVDDLSSFILNCRIRYIDG